MRIVLVGFGSVGKGVARLLERRAGDLYAREGLRMRLVGVIDSRGAAVCEHGLGADELLEAKERAGTVGAMRDHGVSGARWAGSASVIREIGGGADVLVESSPSSLADPMPAFENLKNAMSSGMHAISVNKAPLAVAMPALLELARFNGVQLRYSGAVGAGTPVLSMARSLSRGDTVTGVRAILNGTTNFILWKMLEEGTDYAAALAEAQRLGYAETDPSTDVDGLDTATKIVILANTLAGGDPARRALTMRDVRVEGIRGIAQSRLKDAGPRGKAVKLIGRIEIGEDPEAAPVVSVAPEEVERHGPLDVARNLNAVQFTTKTAGEVSIVGAGAGGEQTATAIVRDLVDIWHAGGDIEREDET